MSNKTKMIIEVHEWTETCQSECCSRYGTDTFVDGSIVSHEQDYEKIIKDVFDHLGYELDLRMTFERK